MNRLLITIGFILITISTYSQSIELNIHQNKLAYFLKVENELKSERFEDNQTYLTQKGIAPPILFKRKQFNLPDLIISYFYFQKDSTISSLNYEWDDKIADGQNPKKTTEEINSFIDKYKELYNQIFKAFGASKSEGDLKDLSKIETGDFRKTDTWEPDDSTDIKLSSVLSSKYEKLGAMTIIPAYRIRLNIRNYSKNTDLISKPDEGKIKEIDLVLKAFLLDLKSKKFDTARLYISDLISKQVTNEQLEMLRQNIKFNDDLILHMYGAQMGLDGSNYLMLQYKYKSDDNNPPKELIKVTFDEKNKITGIQPVKRQEINYQPPIVTTKVVPANDSTHFSITILDNSYDVKIRDKAVNLRNDKEVNNFIEMNKSLIDPNKISIYTKANTPFDRFKPILDVLKKHGYNKFQMISK